MCTHDQKNSCPHCSLVKLVAYLQNDTKIVWYSFFKEEQKLKQPDAISVQMGTRLEKNYGSQVKKMMFFDNQTGAQEIIAEN